MNVVDKALETQLRNIQTRTGKSLDELYGVARSSGFKKHGEIRDLFKRDLGVGHGDANTLAQFYLKSVSQPTSEIAGATTDDPLNAIYSGARAALRPIHDQLLAAISTFGTFEIAPKKANVSLRRRKQFALIGPGTKGRVDIGLNMKGIKGTERLVEMPAGGMCQYTVKVTDISEVDSELLGWIKRAFDDAG